VAGWWGSVLCAAIVLESPLLRKLKLWRRGFPWSKSGERWAVPALRGRRYNGRGRRCAENGSQMEQVEI